MWSVPSMFQPVLPEQRRVLSAAFMRGAEHSQGTRSPVASWSHITGKPKHFTANREDTIPSQSRDPRGSQFPEPILRLLRWVLGVHEGRRRAGLYWFLETPCPAPCLLTGRPWRWAEAEWSSCRWWLSGCGQSPWGWDLVWEEEAWGCSPGRKQSHS